MGIPLTVFTLHRLRNEGAGCLHHLLLKVEQPAFSNADAGAYDHAVEVAEGKRRVLIRAYEEMLTGECAAPHEVSLVGELQAWPAGDELIDGRRGYDVDLWVAETRFGHPWVVLGTAESEEAFWREVAADEDLARLDPVRPAVRHRAFFLAEEESQNPA
jgi:hypothetical protein